MTSKLKQLYELVTLLASHSQIQYTDFVFVLHTTLVMAQPQHSLSIQHIARLTRERTVRLHYAQVAFFACFGTLEANFAL